MANLMGIATHTQAKGEISTHDHIEVSTEHGLNNDYQGSRNKQTQVTLLSLKSWQQACAECGAELDWTTRRANLLVDDFEFTPSMIGEQIQVGDVLLQISCETDPCSLMDKLHPGLKHALTPNWRGGARCMVLRGGIIKLGDKISHLKRF